MDTLPKNLSTLFSCDIIAKHIYETSLENLNIKEARKAKVEYENEDYQFKSQNIAVIMQR